MLRGILKAANTTGPDTINHSHKSPLTLFDEAARKVTEERGAIYGHPLDDFTKVTAAAQALGLPSMPDAPIRHALYMVLVKVARLVTSPDHLDSITDLAGYARTIAMILDKRAEPKDKVVYKGVHSPEFCVKTIGCKDPEKCLANGFCDNA